MTTRHDFHTYTRSPYGRPEEPCAADVIEAMKPFIDHTLEAPQPDLLLVS